MTIRVKDSRNNRFYAEKLGNSIEFLRTDYTSATSEPKTEVIGLPDDLSKYSRIEIIISGDPAAVLNGAWVALQNASGQKLSCDVQGWECWNNAMNFINRSQSKIADLNWNFASFIRVCLYPTASNINYVPFTVSTYGGSFGGNSATTQNFNGRCNVASSQIKYLAYNIPVMKAGYRVRVLCEL